jgi:membrane-associated phospholipid phosphatase
MHLAKRISAPHAALAGLLAPATVATKETRLGATDVLLLTFIAGLATLSLAYGIDGPAVAPTVLLGVVIVLVAAWPRESRHARVVHDFFPVIAVIAIFELLGSVIPAVNPARWDATFAALDAHLFGRLPSAWFGALGRPPWLTDLASAAYVSYYVLPVALGVALYTRDRDEFRRFAFTVVATFLVSYIGYLIFPTLGPRTTDAVLGGGAVSRAVRAFVHVAEANLLDAFPSGHVAVATVCVGCGWRLFPRWRVPLAIALVGICFSTVYLSYHYVIDVVAGAGLAAGLLLALPPFTRRLIGSAQRPSSHPRHRPPPQAIRSNRPAR